MARIIPADYKTNNGGMHESERQTLDYLEEALPDTWTVFSSVLWARSHAHNTRIGELDFCVVSPSGHLIVIEQKSGGLTVRDGNIYKRYGITEKDAGKQIIRSISALKEVWQKQHQGKTVAVDYLLYLPDYQLKELTGLQFDASRIIHAGSKHSLPQALENLCGDAAANPVQVQAMHDFLTGALELELDIGRLQSHQEALYRRHEDTLHSWVSRLAFSPYVLRVNGCAGSGKTQLGIGLFREARNKGEQARYICFNRPLADSLAKAMNDAVNIQTRDHFYNCFLHSQGIQPEHVPQGSDYFLAIEEQVAGLPIPASWMCDVLIIDEGQDIPARSLSVLRRFLKPQGRLIWLEDPDQNLYGHMPVTLENAVALTLNDCFRSPAAIVRYLTALLPLKRPLIPANPHYGEAPVFHVADNATLTDLLAKRLTERTAQGIRPKDIALISLHGISKSALANTEILGDYRLSRFTGEYDENGQQIWTSGEVLLDSIYRFKGSQRPFIFLIDADFTQVDEKVTRLFYCGMTRATLGLEIFLTPDCERALAKDYQQRSGA